ncbi:MAG: hypothetical protein GC129_03570 [Proteobacteria bacterium]|nr:hypothetical protein [Pseudomonadota bacterium]
MPSYTILIMRKDVTDRRPHTIHIGTKLFWFLILFAVGAPIVGFVVSAGWIAPSWLKFNMHSMEQKVEKAEKNLQPLQQQNADLAQRKATLEDQLKTAREALATLETKSTMAETARTEAATRLAAAETELITLKQSLATYEKLLKPKLEKELLQCVNLDVDYKGGVVSYKTTFSKIGQNMNVPAVLNVRVRALTGDNAVSMEQGQNQAQTATHQLQLAKSPTVSGKIPLPEAQATGTTRLVDLKVYDGSTPVAYCWKAF